jgi:hypothetical protein
MPDDELEYDESAHSYAAGKQSALKQAHAFLLERAGLMFAQGRDEVASQIREAARHIEVEAKKASEELQRHINRSLKRRKK